MIMPRGQQLLLPARPLFIWGSLLVALIINMTINMGILGRTVWAPDFLAVLLVFWTIHQPQRVGIGTAFVLGLITDVHQGSLLGQSALAYTVLCYLATTIHRRLLWFGVPSQAAQVFPLFCASHVLMLSVRLLAGAEFPGFLMGLAPVFEALLWPVVSVLLLIPQKRAPDPDANRPL